MENIGYAEVPESAITEGTSRSIYKELDMAGTSIQRKEAQSSELSNLPDLQISGKDAGGDLMQKCIDQSCNKARDAELKSLQNEIHNDLSRLPKESQLKFNALQKQDESKALYGEAAMTYIKAIGALDILQKMRRANDNSQIVY